MKVRLTLGSLVILFSLLSPILTMEAIATVPLSNDQITYAVNNQDVRVINSDGTNDTMLVDHSVIPYSTAAQISPDRTKIYYVGGSSPRDLHSINADGTGNTDLGYNAAGSLSFDGTKLVATGPAYTNSTDHNNYSSIQIQNIDGTGTTDIHPSVPGSSSNPTWMKDGSIVFRFDQHNTSGNWDTCYSWLAKINADGTGFTELTPDNTGQPSGSCAGPDNPAVDPVSGKIAYDTGATNLNVMNADGTGVTQLYAPTGTGFAARPTWSPDGSKIATSYRASSGNTVYIGIFNASTGSLISTIGAKTGGVTITWLDWASRIP